MKIRLPPFIWGVLVGLLYGMITMFPEWLFYAPSQESISVGMILNTPVTLLLLTMFDDQRGFGYGAVADHYFILIFVLAVDAVIGGIVFSAISALISGLRSRTK